MSSCPPRTLGVMLPATSAADTVDLNGSQTLDHPAEAAKLEDSGLRYHQGLTAPLE